MNSTYQVPDLSRRSFARTNIQTIAQRVALLSELLSGVSSIAELCGGDCTQQWQAYTQQLGISAFHALDIDPGIVARNRQAGMTCTCGDVLNAGTLSLFVGFDVLFFGPPLSVDCDGHRALRFDQITPAYSQFARLLLDQLRYDGTVVCICPNSMTMGDIAWLYHQIRDYRPDVGLRLIHHSWATVTGEGKEMGPRLKYVELWFSTRLADAWEIRVSGSTAPL